ncbi:hypothetical protein L6R29_06295 [Myxococcota bacterium]|nr:hypothetical protein [Myxococcota bacterium]
MRKPSSSQHALFFHPPLQPQTAAYNTRRDDSGTLPTIVAEPPSMRGFDGFPFLLGDAVRVLPESGQPLAGCRGMVVCVYPSKQAGGVTRFRVRFSSSLAMEFPEDALELELDASGLLSDGVLDALVGAS